MEVTLEWYEYELAAQVGLRRQLESIKQGLQDAHGFSGPGWDQNVEGAIGEMVVAKALGIYWDGSVNTFKAPDFPPNLQVRTRPKEHHKLIVRPFDSMDDTFILVTGKCPNYVVRGYINGGDTRNQEWLFDEGNGRPPAFFVPHEELSPIKELKDHLVRTANIVLEIEEAHKQSDDNEEMTV